MSTSSLSTKSSEESILEAIVQVGYRVEGGQDGEVEGGQDGEVEGGQDGEVEGGQDGEVEGGQEWRGRMCVQLKRADILVHKRRNSKKI